MKVKQILCFTLLLLWTGSVFGGVATSFPVLTMIVRDLIGPEVHVYHLAGSGEEAHHFEPGPKELIELYKQDLLIVNGLGFEHWLPALRTRPSFKVPVIVASEGLSIQRQFHGHPDPHAWHDPENLLVYISNIEKGLCQAYPGKKTTILERGSKLRKQIAQWREEQQQEFKKIKSSGIFITAHNAYNYLAESHGLRFLGLMEDHEGESLAPRSLTQQLKTIQDKETRIFLGDGSKQDVTLQEWAVQTKSIWGGILWGDQWPKDQQLPSILSYMDHNSTLIINSLKQANRQPKTPVKN